MARGARNRAAVYSVAISILGLTLIPRNEVCSVACGYSFDGACMAGLDAVLEQLIRERKRAEGELRQLEKVIAQLSRVRTASSRSSSGSGKRMKRRLSAAARERIAAAQRERWAKVRAQSRKVSSAA